LLAFYKPQGRDNDSQIARVSGDAKRSIDRDLDGHGLAE
jgi:hypothetical protein